MWLIGALGFYFIYRLEFRWYMISIIKMGYSPMSVPMILLNPRFHYLVHGLAICLFCFSTYFFYKTNPWLVLLAPVLLLLAFITHGAKQSNRTDAVINLAVAVDLAEEAKGSTRAQINDAICLATLGEGWDIGADRDLKGTVKGMILPATGLLPSLSSIVRSGGFNSPAHKRYQADCEEIDAKIDAAYQRKLHSPQVNR